MSIFEAILLGIIQGIFMFFPVSSTSHLVLTQHWLIQRGSSLPPPESSEMIFFDLIVHVGTLISIVVVFRRSLGRLLTRIWRDFYQLITELNSARKDPIKLRVSAMRTRSLIFPSGERQGDFLYLRLAILGMLSVVVTGLVGLPFRSIIKQVFFAYPLAISFTLSITGILLWWTDKKIRQTRGLRQLTPWVATVIGLGQALSLIPGLSRSGMTISFSLFTGLRRQWAAEYSFFIAFPTILGGTLLQGLELLQEETLNIGFIPLTVGFIVSAVVGIGALQLVLKLLYRARFRYFSYYLWVLAIIVGWAAYQGIV